MRDSTYDAKVIVTGQEIWGCFSYGMSHRKGRTGSVNLLRTWHTIKTKWHTNTPQWIEQTSRWYINNFDMVYRFHGDYFMRSIFTSLKWLYGPNRQQRFYWDIFKLGPNRLMRTTSSHTAFHGENKYNSPVMLVTLGAVLVKVG